MKFSMWLEGRKRNQKSDMKMPARRTNTELFISGPRPEDHPVRVRTGRAGEHGSRRPGRGEENRGAISRSRDLD